MCKAYSYHSTALNGLYILLATTYNIAQVNEATETKYLAQGYKHVGGSRTRTHGLPFHWITHGSQMLISFIKGIVSDSNNIFLWHKSQDINKIRLFPKFQLIPMLRKLTSYAWYVHWHCSIDYCVKLSRRDNAKNGSHFKGNDFYLIPLRKCASWRRATDGCKTFKILKFLRAPSMWNLGVCL